MQREELPAAQLAEIDFDLPAEGAERGEDTDIEAERHQGHGRDPSGRLPDPRGIESPPPGHAIEQQGGGERRGRRTDRAQSLRRRAQAYFRTSRDRERAWPLRSIERA